MRSLETTGFESAPLLEDAAAGGVHDRAAACDGGAKTVAGLKNRLHGLLAEERLLHTDILSSTILYYVDIGLDTKACIGFLHHGKYKYASSVVSSVGINAVISGCAQDQNLPSSSNCCSILTPAVIAWKALTLPPSAAAGKSKWDDADIRSSHQRLNQLRVLRGQLQVYAGHEATIEAPVNSLVQMMAACNMHIEHGHLTSQEVFLWISVSVSIVSMVKAYVGWETYGRVHMAIDKFSYVMGSCRSTLAKILVAFFRLVEILSRLCILIALHEVMVTTSDAWWAHYAVVAVMGISPLLLFLIGSTSQPRNTHHALLCIPAFFVYPAPLIAPSRAKSAGTSALTHYALRGAENLLLLGLCWARLDLNLETGCKLFGGAACLFVTITVQLFLLIAVVYLFMAEHSACVGLKKLMAEQLLQPSDNHLSLQWPPDAGVQAVLRSYGFAPSQIESHEGFPRSMTLSAATEVEVLSSLPAAVLEDLYFHELLDDEKARVLVQHLPRFLALKKVSFSHNFQFSANTWAAVLGSLPAGVLEDLAFNHCALDDEKAKSLAQHLPRFLALKKVSFSHNSQLSADAWAAVLSSLPAGVMEYLDFSDCKLGDERARALAQHLPCFLALKKVNFRGSSELSADAWAAVLGSLPAGVVEDLDFTDCASDDEKAKALAQHLPRFLALKRISLGFNGGLSADAWAAVLSSLPARLVEDLDFTGYLGGRGLDDEKANKARALAQHLPRFLALKKVSFFINGGLSADAWAAVLDSLPAEVLEDLDFSDCALDDEKAKALAQHLPRFLALKKVSFRSNHKMSADAWAAVLGSLPAGVVEDLDFSACELDDEKARVLAQILSRFLALKNIDFRGNAGVSFGGLAHVLLVTSARPNMSFKSSKGVGHGSGRPMTVHFSHVSELKFDPTQHLNAVDVNFDWLAQGDALRSVSLMCIGSEMSSQICAAVLDSLPTGVLECLDFSHCDLNEEKARALAQHLPRFLELRKVDFSRSEFSADAWAAVLGSLPAGVLEDLAFFECALDDEKAKALAQHLPRFLALKKINFRCNSVLSIHAWAAVLDSLPAELLEDLDLSDCELDDEKAMALAQHLPRFFALKKVRFNYNSDISDFGWAAVEGLLPAAVEVERVDGP